MGTTSTLSEVRQPADAPCQARAHLFVALACATPLEPPSRHALHGVDEVRIGRGAAPPRHDRSEAGRLTLTLSDGRVSSAHARLACRDGRWTVEDLASKNGTLLNGMAVREGALNDGDCVQVGQTILIFRADLPTPPRTALDIEASAPVPALATLLPQLARELDRLAPVADSRMPVLLISETGTGKEVLARAVHALSRRAGSFVPINCAALPTGLVESLLFGHKKGAFSGALSDHPGIFRAATGGTILLDEVGDMPLAVQSAVLRALQDGEVLPVGATQPTQVDVRVISATHRNLEARVHDGAFREDLLARLSGFSFRLPPLRERREDIGLLSRVFLGRIADEQPWTPALTAEAGMMLLRHGWPRNVRELEKCLIYAAALAGDGPIAIEHLPEGVRQGGEARRSFSPDDQLHARLIGLLAETGGNVSTVAETMRTSRSQVHRWMKRFAIEARTFRRRRGQYS